MIRNDNLTEEFFKQFPTATYGSGQPILHATEQLDKVHFVSSGYVRQFIVSSAGVELTVHLFKPGAFFPLMQALNSTPNRYFYDAFTEVSLHIAPASQVQQFLQQNPLATFDLSQRLLMGLDGLLTRIEIVAFGSANVRVADGLVFLAKHFGQSAEGGLRIKHPLTHKSIAQVVGLTRETTSLELKSLAAIGLIRREGDYFILPDPEGLKQVAIDY